MDVHPQQREQRKNCATGPKVKDYLLTAITRIHSTERSVYHVLSQCMYFIYAISCDATSKMSEPYFSFCIPNT